jgi:ABC-type sugar transport system permease subunit
MRALWPVIYFVVAISMITSAKLFVRPFIMTDGPAGLDAVDRAAAVPHVTGKSVIGHIQPHFRAGP